MPPSKQKTRVPASAGDIRRILGKTDDDLVLAVGDTGATPEEVLQAFEWLEDDDYMGGEAGKKLSDRIRKVYDILLEDRDGDEERRK